MNINKKYRLRQYSESLHQYYPDFQQDLINIPNVILCPTITFQITDDCNLQCSYCYQINKNHHIMPLQIAKDFIDMLLDNNTNIQPYIDTQASLGVVLEFIGGEPFLQIDLIDQILDYFIKQAILKNHPWQYLWRIAISSNGTLYFNDNVQKFLNKWEDKLSLNISIDGNKQLHDKCRLFPNGEGSYDKAISAALDYMNNRKHFLGTKMTLSPNNIQYTYDAIINLIDLGYTEINLNCIFEKGWENQHAIILYQELKKITDYLIKNNLEDDIFLSIFNENIFDFIPLTDKSNSCGGNGSMLSIDYKGDLYPCIRYMESSLGDQCPPYIIGNIYTGFMDTITSQKIVKILRNNNRINQSPFQCLICPINHGCAYCQAYNYQNNNGNFGQRATYTCIMHKARYLANVYFWNQIYKKQKLNKHFPLLLPKKDCLLVISLAEYKKLKKISKKSLQIFKKERRK